MLIKEVIKNKSMIFNLAKDDFKKRFVGSYFGLVWMFVQPLATILVYTLIFQVGFKSTPPVANIPYVLWLIPGIIPWFYFQDALIQGTGCLYEYQYLVKKVVFNVAMLPIIKIVSILFSHICFIVIMFVVVIISHTAITYKAFAIIYFSFATTILALGITYFTSSINVFFKDMAQIVSILLQFGMWMAPIMYDDSLFIERAPIVCTLLKFNPFYYIVKGYRWAIIGDTFNDFTRLSIYFWFVTFIIFIIGYNMFNKLKIHFSDVL